MPDQMAEKVLQPLGLERRPAHLTDGEGLAFVPGGIVMTTRDLARFGQMVAKGGIWQGVRIVPGASIADGTRPTAPTAPDDAGCGDQWRIPQGWPEGAFAGRGICGRYLCVNRPLNVVIVASAANRRFAEPGAEAADVAMLQRIAAAVAAGG
jgi:CubicO group peptidase (beta-lactamase class C family)